MQRTLIAAFAGLFLVASTAAGTAAQVRRPLPVIQRLEPTSGPPGSTITIIGRHFDRNQTVWLGASQLQVQTRLPNRWTVQVADGAQGGALEIRTARGRVRGPRFRVTQAGPAPVVSSFRPTSGAAGTEVVIEGENFSPRLAENSVHLGSQPLVVRHATPTRLTVIIAAGAESGPLRVRVAGSGEATSDGSFSVGEGVRVASFTPAIGPPGTQVTLSGGGFGSSRRAIRVYLGEQRARLVSSTPNELVVQVPRRNASTGRFMVEVRGRGRVYSGQTFTVRTPPRIRTVEPSQGAPGTELTVRGRHFGTDVAEISVRLGETALRVRDLADDRVVVEIPEGASTGTVEVTVRGLEPARSRRPFRVLTPVVVSGFLPRHGAPGTEVTIRGRGFSTTTGQNRVTLSGQVCEVVRSTETTLTVRIPASSSGPLVVVVPNAGEGRTRHPFIITRSPTVTDFTPTSGPPGTVVTIRGTNFGQRQGLIDVRLGERRATVRSSTDTQLRVVVPPNAETGRFRVRVRLQGSATAGEDFRVTD